MADETTSSKSSDAATARSASLGRMSMKRDSNSRGTHGRERRREADPASAGCVPVEGDDAEADGGENATQIVIRKHFIVRQRKLQLLRRLRDNDRAHWDRTGPSSVCRPHFKSRSMSPPGPNACSSRHLLPSDMPLRTVRFAQLPDCPP
jgi:hypothetical protein